MWWTKDILKSKWNGGDHLAGKSVRTNGGVRVCSRNRRQSRYPAFIWLGLRNQICTKENPFQTMARGHMNHSNSAMASIKPAPPSCPVCPAQLPPHQRTHPHWSGCWAPPVKIRSCYDHWAKYANRVSTRFCILGRFYIFTFIFYFDVFQYNSQNCDKSKKCLILLQHDGLGVTWRWSNRTFRQSGMKLEKIKQDLQSPCGQR